VSRTPWRDVPDARRRIMKANRRRDTGPELGVRSVLHRRGLRYRVDFPVTLDGRPRAVRPDVVFPRQRVALFVDGCWWHGCPAHSSVAATNVVYWKDKIAANRERDARNTAHLEAVGWTVIRAWAHEDPEDVADRVAFALGR